jgi:cell division protein FtsB
MKSLWVQKESYLRIKRRKLDVSPRLARALLIIVLVLISMIFIAGDVGLWNLWKAQNRLQRLNNEIEKLKKENEILGKSIVHLEKDDFAIEKVAREKYGYLRPGDRVYRMITLPLSEETTENNFYPLDRDKKKL